MGSVKRVLLGSAAGIVAVAGAQAADLPIKAKPVEYVKVCSLYGAGFWYVPGTDTCIKIGAFAKLDTFYNAGGGGAITGGGNGVAAITAGRFDRIDTQNFNWRSRAAISFDIREQTEYGTLRSYVNVGTDHNTSDAGGGTNGFAAVAVFVDRAFLQFAGFTAGRIRSFFDIVSPGPYGLSNNRTNGDTSANGIMGIGYTLQFGGGHGKSIVNLSTTASTAALGTAGATLGTLAVGPMTIGSMTTDNKGQTMFDPVIGLRLDQSWGFVAASGALHDASGGNYASPATGANLGSQFNGVSCPTSGGGVGGSLTGSDACGHPGDKFGWAGSAGFTLTNLWGGQDSMGAQGTYSVGAAGYATKAFGNHAMFGSGNNVGLGWVAEGVFANGTQIELTTVWSMYGFYEHYWTPKFRSSLYGGIVGVEYSSTAKSMICANPAAPLGFSNNTPGGAVTNNGAFINGTVSNCNPDLSWSQLGSRTMWNPVPNLDVGVDFNWVHLDTAFAGIANLTASGGRPAAVYTISNQDVFAAYFRIQRNFLY